MTVPDLDHHEPKHLGYLLERVQDHMRADLGATAAAHGMSGALEGLRPSHGRLLSLIPDDGARVTDVAVLAKMTKQALGQFMDQLEAAGYVASSRDAADRRSRVVSRTEAGDRVVAAVNRLYEVFEQDWRESVGPRRWATFRSVLLQLAVGWEND